MKPSRILWLVIIAWVLSWTSSASAFSDINGHWANKDIVLMSAKGLLGGFPDGAFKPEAPVTRAQFAKIEAYFQQAEEDLAILQTVETQYQDVPSQHWGKGSILWCRENAVMKGYGNNSFAPNKSLTRVEAAVIFARMLNLPKAETSKVFSDRSAIPDWAGETIVAAAASGIITGYSDGSFKPNKTISRAEIAVMLGRAYDVLGGRYEGYGTLKSIDGVNKKVVMESYGQKMTLSYDNNLAVFEKHPVRLGQVLLPAKVFYVLSKTGKLAYLEISKTKPALNFAFSQVQQVTSSQSAYARSKSDKAFLLQKVESAPANSRENILTEVNASRLPDLTGRGEKVAVIDSGIDVGTNNNVIAWKDFTREGLVITSSVPRSVVGTAYFRQNTYQVSSLFSKSGSLRMGSFKNHVFAVVDAKTSGVYDVVYIDSNGNGDFADEKPLELYSSGKTYLNLGITNDPLHVVLSGIEKDGHEVNFGFDATGHGSEVASLLSGKNTSKGIASEAQLLAFKVVQEDGDVDPNHLKDALKYAADNGAKIIALGFTPEFSSSEVQDSFRKILEELHQKNILLILPLTGSGDIVSEAALSRFAQEGLLLTGDGSLRASAVAGVAACLLQYGDGIGKYYTSDELKEAFIQAGSIQAEKALAILQAGVQLPRLVLTSEFGGNNPRLNNAFTPDRVAVVVKNPLAYTVNVVWQSDATLQPVASELFIPPGGERVAWFKITYPEKTGLVKTVLVARDTKDSKVFGRMPISFSKSISDGNYLGSEKLKSGEYKHYFFDMEKDTASVVLKLQENTGSSPRLNMYLIQPDESVYTSNVRNLGTSVVIDKPKPGRWEAVVEYLGQYQDPTQEVAFTFSLWASVSQKTFLSELSNDSYIFSIYPKKILGQNSFTLTIRDKKNYLPAQGNVAINGTSYILRQGRVIFDYQGDSEDVDIKLGWTAF